MPKGVYPRDGRRVFGRAIRPWTQEELEAVMARGDKPLRLVAQSLGRTRKAVERRVALLREREAEDA